MINKNYEMITTKWSGREREYFDYKEYTQLCNTTVMNYIKNKEIHYY